MSETVLKINNVTKDFGSVKALRGMDIEFKKGEIIGLIGSNGAGKSTLLNIIWGAYAPTSGEVIIDGKKMEKITPEKAQSMGINIIFQHRRLMPYMSVAENIFLDRMPKKNGIIDYKTMNEEAKKVINMLDLDIDVKQNVEKLSAEEKQLVEIAKSCSRNPKILLMDEPTTALRQHEVEKMFEVMRNLKSKGCTVVFISHRLKEIMEICDTVTVIRDGLSIASGPKDSFTPDRIVDLMSSTAGKKVGFDFVDETEKTVSKEVLLKAENIITPNVHNVGFNLHKGEILGFAGLGGCGIDDIFNGLFGIEEPSEGTFTIDGKKVRIKNPKTAVKHGIGYVPEDRQLCGEFLGLSVRNNISIPKAQKSGLFSIIKSKYEEEAVDGYIKKLSIKTPDRDAHMRNLSGGNQQKAIFAKWLHIKSRMIVMCEPTAGIDVAAKNEVIKLLKGIASEGKGIFYTSSYINELMEVSDRIVCVYKGEIFKEFSREEFDNNKIYLAMNGIE